MDETVPGDSESGFGCAASGSAVGSGSGSGSGPGLGLDGGLMDMEGEDPGDESGEDAGDGPEISQTEWNELEGECDGDGDGDCNGDRGGEGARSPASVGIVWAWAWAREWDWDWACESGGGAGWCSVLLLDDRTAMYNPMRCTATHSAESSLPCCSDDDDRLCFSSFLAARATAFRLHDAGTPTGSAV